ncbi:hypothetical protein [Paracoccus mutanolyticus]|uniref:hypothetical protein n=1 Tax=Paracoccus mutanolyticus TaxID=1499308 RepID=UPI001CB907CD|nr:hypothetical protein [Paracoccus mutanolyticus]
MIDLIAGLAGMTALATGRSVILGAGLAALSALGRLLGVLEVIEGAYGGRPRSDGPDSIDNLMANTRSTRGRPGDAYPADCDRYEFRMSVPPRAKPGGGSGPGRHRPRKPAL